MIRLSIAGGEGTEGLRIEQFRSGIDQRRFDNYSDRKVEGMASFAQTRSW